jgi:DNA polymerase-3 subunit epsilon
MTIAEFFIAAIFVIVIFAIFVAVLVAANRRNEENTWAPRQAEPIDPVAVARLLPGMADGLEISREFPDSAAGVTFANNDGSSRQRIIANGVAPGIQLRLYYEPENPADSNAVAVCLPDGRQIGYLRQDVAWQVCAAVKQGGGAAAIVLKRTGGTPERPAYGVNIWVQLYDRPLPPRPTPSLMPPAPPAKPAKPPPDPASIAKREGRRFIREMMKPEGKADPEAVRSRCLDRLHAVAKTLTRDQAAALFEAFSAECDLLSETSQPAAPLGPVIEILGRDLPPRVLALDVETTGLGETDRVVSLGALLLETAPLREERFAFTLNHLIFNPGIPSHPIARHIHGWSDAQLQRQECFADKAATVCDLIDAADLIIAHNAAFDLRFLDRELAGAGRAAIAKPVFCTMKEWRRRGLEGSASLTHVAKHFDLGRSPGVHNPLDDARLALLVYLSYQGLPLRFPFDALQAAASPTNLRL